MSSVRCKATVITHSPSPYQVELFDAVAERGEIELDVVYLFANDPERQWQRRAPAHRCAYVGAAAGAEDALLARHREAKLLVLNYYRHPYAEAALHERASAGGPWCFWGERPRLHALGAASRLYRAWKLRALRRSPAPIWGIGRMAIDAYRKEFGNHRPYVNLPYFSNIERFQRIEAPPRRDADPERVFLFSGLLIRRKGVDLVAQAFARLVREGLPVRLKIMGYGAMEEPLRQILADCHDQVEWVGFRDWDAVPQVYASADLLCAPSRYDGWGLVVPEGLAAGLPVISTVQTGAAVEFIKDGTNGWLIPVDDGDAVYRAMREAATVDRAALAAMSAQARAAVSGHSLAEGARRFIEATSDAISNW